MSTPLRGRDRSGGGATKGRCPGPSGHIGARAESVGWIGAARCSVHLTRSGLTVRMQRGSLHVVATTSSASSTADLGAALAELAQPFDLLLLTGDLGAGKTAFCQGFGRGLGIDAQITSPTFTLVRSYTGRLDLYHLDVYRLEQLEEVV